MTFCWTAITANVQIRKNGCNTGSGEPGTRQGRDGIFLHVETPHSVVESPMLSYIMSNRWLFCWL